MSEKQEIKDIKIRMKCSAVLMILIILETLSCTTLSIPSGDPAPGRSPGPPTETYTEYQYETSTDVVTTAESDTDVASLGGCAYARVPTESDRVVTVTENDSEVNLTINHPVFETDELVRGVVYEAVLQEIKLLIEGSRTMCVTEPSI